MLPLTIIPTPRLPIWAEPLCSITDSVYTQSLGRRASSLRPGGYSSNSSTWAISASPS